LIGYFIHDLVEFDMISTYIYGALLMGIMFCFLIPKVSQESVHSKNWQRFSGIFTGILIVGLILGVYVPSWRGSVYAEMGSRANANGKFKEADVLYDKSMSIKSPYALWYIGDTYGAFVNAYALETYDSDPATARRMLEKGIAKYKEVLQIEPLHIQRKLTYAALQTIYDQLTNNPERLGEKTFKELIAQNPDREYFYYMWGQELFFMNRMEEARDTFLKAASYPSVAGDIYLCLAAVEIKLGNDQIVQDYIRKATAKSLDTNIPPAYLGSTAQYAEKHGMKNEAVIIQEKLYRMFPTNKTQMTNMAVLYHQAGQIEKAKAVAQKMLKLFPENQQDILNFMNSL
jgi:tetratricopeptide (TPR) repeat protein